MPVGSLAGTYFSHFSLPLSPPCSESSSRLGKVVEMRLDGFPLHIASFFLPMIKLLTQSMKFVEGYI